VDNGDLVGTLDGVREETRRLVDGDKVRVFEEDFDGHLDRTGGGLAGGGESYFDGVARVDNP
jgi:hypothetical protein